MFGQVKNLRKRVFIRKCPCGCGRDESDLGVYRGFSLTQKPFYDKDWIIYAEKKEMDELDRRLLVQSPFLGKLYADTGPHDVPSGHYTLEQIEENITKQIDDFWSRKDNEEQRHEQLKKTLKEMKDAQGFIGFWLKGSPIDITLKSWVQTVEDYLKSQEEEKT